MLDCKLDGRRQPSVLGTSTQLSSSSWGLQSHVIMSPAQDLVAADFTIVNVSYWCGGVGSAWFNHLSPPSSPSIQSQYLYHAAPVLGRHTPTEPQSRTQIGLSQSAHSTGLAIANSSRQKTWFKPVRNTETFAGPTGKMLPSSKSTPRKETLSPCWTFM